MRDDMKTVGAFLKAVKNCLADDGSWVLWNAPKNRDFLLAHGLTMDDVREIVEDLFPSHVTQGPMDDDSPSRDPGTIFVFEKYFEHERRGIWLYIKLEILDSNPFCVVMSIHESLRNG